MLPLSATALATFVKHILGQNLGKAEIEYLIADHVLALSSQGSLRLSTVLLSPVTRLADSQDAYSLSREL